ncbi:MAG: 50S ribosomal protein L10 [Propionibacteriaceae bacterium]|jgi:large subunit ribosomal protein L10|nr:50S ribosomal protein L10 [Propionibacteriaceae bacterium]
MARPDKAQTVAQLQESFSGASAAVLTEYRGLSVKDLKQLRRSLGEDATYAITKNTLTQIAAREAGIEGLDEFLAGPTAIAFITGDIASVAKGLRDFAKEHPALVVKAGLLDGHILDADAVKKLADLESREVLLAKMAGALKANLSKAVYLFAAPLSQAARAFGALEQAATENPALLAGGAPKAETTAPAADAAAPAAEAAAPAADEVAAPAADAPEAEASPAAEAATDTQDTAPAASTEE